jgi:hypothetical protein
VEERHFNLEAQRILTRTEYAHDTRGDPRYCAPGREKQHRADRTTCCLAILTCHRVRSLLTSDSRIKLSQTSWEIAATTITQMTTNALKMSTRGASHQVYAV